VGTFTNVTWSQADVTLPLSQVKWWRLGQMHSAHTRTSSVIGLLSALRVVVLLTT